MSKLIEHYGSGYEEQRLSGGAGCVERDRTREIVSRHLPATPAVIHDIGGGAGVHATWLLSLGHEVHLVDPVPVHVERAREHMGAEARGTWSASVGDARALALDSDSADVVLMLGPLYHLTERHERVLALREARRTLKPGGILFAAAISRFASLLDGMARNLLDDPAFLPIVTRDLVDGQHRNPTDNPQYFTETFFHRADELDAELVDGGFTVESICGLEGPTWLLEDIDARWSDARRRQTWMELLARVETEPTVVGMSAHLLGIARKPAQPQGQDPVHDLDE